MTARGFHLHSHAHIERWELERRAAEALQGELLEKPPGVEHSEQLLERQARLEREHWFGWKFDELDRVVASSAQLELDLPKMSERDRVRQAVADYLDRVVKPHTWLPSEWELGSRLRRARSSFYILTRPEDGKVIIRWEDKAGLPLLDPDDAREEAMRVQRRVVPRALELLQQPGARVYYGVFTMPNVAPGELRVGMRWLSKRFNAMLKKCQRDESLPILGAYAVMECPLGRRRDWHPHLNVLLVTSGWLDFKKVRELWEWNVELRRLEGSQDRLEASMREIIKYSVRAVPEKSYEHARADAHDQHGAPLGVDTDQRCGTMEGSTGGSASGHAPVGHGSAAARDSGDGRGVAPPLTEWTCQEFLEWWRAHRRFRRSRGYGCLYRLEDPEPLDLVGFIHTGNGARRGPFGYTVQRAPLLESIPGDKSSPGDLRKRLREAWMKLLGPPDQLDRALRAAAIVKEHYGPVSLAV